MNNDAHLIFEALMYSQKTKDIKGHSTEAEESHCSYAAKGCDCGECEGCQDNAMKGEDAESSNVDVDTLIDTIKEYQVKKGNREYAYSYVVGVLSSIIKEALHSPKSLQSSINRSYQSFTEKE